MSSKPIIYCCVPRPGLIFMSLVFGSFGLLPSLGYIFSTRFFHIESFTDFMGFIGRILTITCTIAFFYSAYLAYKRNYKPFKYLIYIFWTSILYDVYSGILNIKSAFDMPFHEHKVKEDIPYNATNNEYLTEEQHYEIAEAVTRSVHTIMPIVVTLLILFLLLNKIYFITKMKSYVDYIMYKKEVARSVPAVELPHKLPECSQ